MQDNFLVTKKLLEDLLNYLGTKPYAEVFQLVGRIQNLPNEQPKTEQPTLNVVKDVGQA